MRRVVAPAVVVVLLSLVNGACVVESEWKTAPKFSMVNNTGLSLNIYYVDERNGLITEPPSDTEMDRTSSRYDSPGYEMPDLLKHVDFDGDGCIDVSIVAFERNFEDPERDGRLVDRIPAGTCWEPGTGRTFTFEVE